MNTNKQDNTKTMLSSIKEIWPYYLVIIVLIVLSLISSNRDVEGNWEITIGFHDSTPLLVALAAMPLLLKLLFESPPNTKKTEVETPFFKISHERFQEIDGVRISNIKEYAKAGQAAIDEDTNREDVDGILKNADKELEDKVTPEERLSAGKHYLLEIEKLAQQFNRNRHLREKDQSSIAEAESIAYEMRSIAPFLYNQFNVSEWLNSQNLGKQLAAIKYLEWGQDIQFAEDLANRLKELEAEGDKFQAYHVLLALYRMANQLAYTNRKKVLTILKSYTPKGSNQTERTRLKNRIEKIIG